MTRFLIAYLMIGVTFAMMAYPTVKTLFNTDTKRIAAFVLCVLALPLAIVTVAAKSVWSKCVA